MIMNKRGGFKRKGGLPNEADNLKRFRKSVEDFTSQHGKKEQVKDAAAEKEEKRFQTKRKKSRKVQRKEQRAAKKASKHAFHTGVKLEPEKIKEKTEEEKQREQKKKEMEEKRKQKEEKLKEKREKKRAKKKKSLQEQMEVSRIKGLREANRSEEKVIKQLEKKLRLNRRKSKSMPQSFIDEGLDYILDAIDPEKLKTLYGTDADDETDITGLDLDSSSVGPGDDLEQDPRSEEEDEEEGMDEEELNEIARLLVAERKAERKKGKVKKDGTSEKQEKPGKKSKSVTFNLPEDDDEVDDSDDDDDIDNDDDSDNGDDSDSFHEDEEDNSNKNIKGVGKIESTLTTGNKKKLKAALKDRNNTTLTEHSKELDSNSDEEDDDEDDANDDSEGNDDDSDEEGLEGEEDESDDEDASDKEEKEEAPKYKEDIYGRLRDAAGNLVSEKQTTAAYVPPGKRLQMAEGDEKNRIKLERLRKQLKGLLNRVSEANVQSIGIQIEAMYRSHSRALLTQTLRDLIMETCVQVQLVPERLSQEIVMLLTLLHGNVGSEVGATFLQHLIMRFDKHFSEGGNYGVAKEMDNILILCSHLYSFKVIHSLLIFDILRKLIESFAEKDIELILLVLRNVGFTLRKDDPAQLKEVISAVQSKASSTDTTQFKDQSRVRFMLDTLMAIKNNNMKKIPNYDPSHLDHLLKLMRTYTKKGGSGDSQLRISLADLLASGEKGRWWLVGSAWAGPNENRSDTASDAVATTITDGMTTQLLELARKQRMNTDVRKNIFCVIMTSEDFVDAFEKLLRLSLKHQQEREIIYVILHCLLQEKTYNAYYTYLLQKFCEYERRFQMTVQFSLWDQFKELQIMKASQRSHLAKAVAHLISSKALSLSVFKKIQFSELDKPRVQYMKQTMLLLLEQSEDVFKEIFLRVAALPKLKLLREGLKLFLVHFVLKGKGSEITDIVRERIKKAEKLLSAADLPMKL